MRDVVAAAAATAASSQAAGSLWGGVLFAGPALVVIACATLAFLAAAFICLLLLLRPLLKRLEALAQAAELAARSMEKASAEFEQASIVINSELPTTLDSVERTSLEFEVLGQSLNGLTGGKRSKSPPGGNKAAPKPANGAAQEKGQERNPVEAIQESTANSMRKVAQDVASLTTALTPAMVAWRKRISFITERFEAASKETAVAVKELPIDSASAKREAQAWVEEWRKRQRELDDNPDKEGVPLDGNLAAAGTKLLQSAVEGAAAVANSQDASSDSDAANQRQGTEEAEQLQALEERRAAAQAVFSALSKAEEAASAAAAASGELETALQAAERHAGGSWWGWNPSAQRSSQARKPPGADNQEHDGMAYPSSPFIAARDREDSSSNPEKQRKGQRKEGAATGRS